MLAALESVAQRRGFSAREQTAAGLASRRARLTDQLNSQGDSPTLTPNNLAFLARRRPTSREDTQMEQHRREEEHSLNGFTNSNRRKRQRREAGHLHVKARLAANNASRAGNTTPASNEADMSTVNHDMLITDVLKSTKHELQVLVVKQAAEISKSKILIKHIMTLCNTFLEEEEEEARNIERYRRRKRKRKQRRKSRDSSDERKVAQEVEVAMEEYGSEEDEETTRKYERLKRHKEKLLQCYTHPTGRLPENTFKDMEKIVRALRCNAARWDRNGAAFDDIIGDTSEGIRLGKCRFGKTRFLTRKMATKAVLASLIKKLSGDVSMRSRVKQICPKVNPEALENQLKGIVLQIAQEKNKNLSEEQLNASVDNLKVHLLFEDD